MSESRTSSPVAPGGLRQRQQEFSSASCRPSNITIALRAASLPKSEMSVYGATTPTFSDEDFARERAALTDAERRKLRQDMYGIADDDEATGIEETTTLIRTSLQLLDEAIDGLSEEEKSTYLLAKESVPELIEDESPPLAFLRCESFDVTAAAKRLCAYWATRVLSFGPDRAFLPMTLDGAMREDYDDFVTHPFMYPIDNDDHGRIVIFWDPSRASALKRDVVLRCCVYILTKLCYRPEFSSKGYVSLGNYQASSFPRDYDRALGKKGLELQWAIGAKIKAFHLCTGPGRSVAGLLLPVIRMLAGSYYRQRLLVHSGSGSDVLPFFEDYGLNEKHIQAMYGPPSYRLAIAQSWISSLQEQEQKRLIYQRNEVETAQLY